MAKLTYEYETGGWTDGIDVKVELKFEEANVDTVKHIAELLGVECIIIGGPDEESDSDNEERA